VSNTHSIRILDEEGLMLNHGFGPIFCVFLQCFDSRKEVGLIKIPPVPLICIGSLWNKCMKKAKGREPSDPVSPEKWLLKCKLHYSSLIYCAAARLLNL